MMEVSESPRSATARVAQEPVAGLRILFVEDHDDTRQVFSRLLSRWGYTVFGAENFRAALDMLHAENFDIILSDIGLPDGDGYSLIARARQQQPSIKAVALTGLAAAADVRLSREAGFDFHLTKPVDFYELRRLLRRPEDGG